MTLWNKIRIFKIFIQLLRDPSRTDLIFKGVEIVADDPNQEPVETIEHFVLSKEGFLSMYKERYVPEAPSLSTLEAYPEDSFGKTLFRHMCDNNLDFTLWPKYDSKRAINYLSVSALSAPCLLSGGRSA